MSRKRALKKRVDFRKGGFVDRKKFVAGGHIFEMAIPDRMGESANFTYDDDGQIYTNVGTGEQYTIGVRGTQRTIVPLNDPMDNPTPISTPPPTSTATTTPAPAPPPAPAPAPAPATTTTTPAPAPATTFTTTTTTPTTTPTTIPTTTSSNGKANGGAVTINPNVANFGIRSGTQQASPISVTAGLTDPDIESKEALQIADRGTIASPENVTATEITAAGGAPATAPQQAPIQASRMDVVKAQDLATTQAAQGQVTREAQAEGPELTERGVAAERDAAQEQAALTQDIELQVRQDAFVQRVVGEQVNVVQTTEAEKQQREATLGMPAPSGEEAQIINEFGFGSSKNRILRGPEAKQAAAGRLVSEHGISQEVADNILEDVGELVTNIDGVSQESLGAIASLPKEALVSSQMESLLAGMEEGKTPVWARPAVAAVEERLAERGLSASSVGRDALFNSIIQSTLPIAQSNAQALQQRAAQNLSNEQQALIKDRQIAADFLGKNAAFKQQMDIANLSNDQQMRLANLTAQNQAGSENLSANQQSELANLNSRMQSNLLQSKLAQEMGVAQLSVDQQTAMNNASMNANIDFTKFTTAQQNALANSKFMQSMTMADFNASQQTAMQNATALASMDMAAADQNTKLAITNAQNFLQMDMSNLSNTQQATLLDQQLMQQRLLSNQSAENASRQFNASSENQINQFMANLGQQIDTFNITQLNAMQQFNATETNRTNAINVQNNLKAQEFNNQLQQQLTMFEEELDFKASQWNAQNAQAVEQANVQWRRQANTINTAAQNEANKMSAQMSFNMTQSEQDFLWQQMRDQAGFSQMTAENKKERAMQALSAMYGNTELMTEKNSYARDVVGRRLEVILGFN